MEPRGMWVYTTHITVLKDGFDYVSAVSHVAWGDETFMHQRARETLENEMWRSTHRSKAKGGSIVYAAYIVEGFFTNEEWTQARFKANKNTEQQVYVKIRWEGGKAVVVG